MGLVDIQFPVNWNNLTTAQGKVIIILYDERHQAVDLVGAVLNYKGVTIKVAKILYRTSIFY